MPVAVLGLCTAVASFVAEHGSVISAHALGCPMAPGIFPGQGLNLCRLHWQAGPRPPGKSGFSHHTVQKPQRDFLANPVVCLFPHLHCLLQLDPKHQKGRHCCVLLCMLSDQWLLLSAQGSLVPPSFTPPFTSSLPGFYLGSISCLLWISANASPTAIPIQQTLLIFPSHKLVATANLLCL